MFRIRKSPIFRFQRISFKLVLVGSFGKPFQLSILADNNMNMGVAQFDESFVGARAVLFICPSIWTFTILFRGFKYNFKLFLLPSILPTLSYPNWLNPSIFRAETIPIKMAGIEIKYFKFDEKTKTYYFPCVCAADFEITRLVTLLFKLTEGL